MFDLQIDKKKKKIVWKHIFGTQPESSGWQRERIYASKHCVFHCSKSKTIHGGTPVQTIMYISSTKGLCTLITHIDYLLYLYLMISISLLAFFIVYVHHFIHIWVIDEVNHSNM
jgi:hypothetical protein